MLNSILKVNGISKNFDELKAVDNVSFEVQRGEIFGLLGPNGAGKTTVIRMIMGIFEPDSGLIEFNKEFKIDKKKAGYLPEERGAYDDTRVLDTIMYFAELKGMSKDKAKKEALKWLDKLQLMEFANSKIEELSKGMQQKVQFIISVIHNPELLVLDEVFSGLDPVNQELFKGIIRQLANKGTTILLSSHRMNMVEELCDRIFLINKGQRVLYGELNKIKEEFGERKVRLLVRGNVSLLKKLSNITNLEIDGERVTFSISLKITPQGLLSSLPEGLEIDEISITKPPLHDIFVSEIKRGDYSA